MGISILLADDHEMVREGFRSILAKEPDLDVLEDMASTGAEAVALAKKWLPDIVVMDVAMPDMNGIDATKEIRMSTTETRVIALSMHEDRRFVVEMLKAGASGYVVKHCTASELVAAIRAVQARQAYLSPRIAGVVVDDALRVVGGQGPVQSVFDMLTTTERRVLQLVAEGLTSKEIALRLGGSPRTIDTHRRNILQKLNLRGVAELTQYAIREGIVSLDT